MSFRELFEGALALDQVNTKPGKNEVVVLQGRFQPPTAGHLKAIKAAYKKYRMPIVIVMIKGAKSDVKFDSKTQKAVFEQMLDMPHIYLELDTGFVGNWIHELRNMGKEPKALFCGSDRVKSYQGQINRYKDQLNLDIAVEEIARTGEDISASKVRDALKNDNFEEFKRNMDPSTYKLYDMLKRKV